MDFLNKKYELVSSENFDEFMKAIGVDQVSRINHDMSAVSTVELRQEEDSYVLVVSYNSKINEVQFKPGEEVDEVRADGVKVKSVYNFEGNTLKQVQKCPDGTEATYVREFEPEQMKAVLTAKDVVCTRMYKAQ